MYALFYYSLPQIYEEFYHTINNADREKDLKWWSNTHGVNMAMNWPYFEVSHMLLWENTFLGLHLCWLLLWCMCFHFKVGIIYLMHCDIACMCIIIFLVRSIVHHNKNRIR